MRAHIRLLVVGLLALASCVGVIAQDDRPEGPPPEEMQRPPGPPPQDDRGDVLRELGLSQEQVQQIRRLNAERRPLMQEAQRRMREANRALDEAIYADEINEATVQARLKDVHAAQGEVARIRFMNEFAVRKILTPEQLVRFRELRAQFEERRQNFERRRRERPMQRPMDGGRMPINNPQAPKPKRGHVPPVARPN